MDKSLIFKAFRAVDDREACLRFRVGHAEVLSAYGITNITTNNEEWMDNPKMYCIVATSPDEAETLGGIRIQISDEKTMLPVEKAIGKMDGKIFDIVKRFRNDGGVGELCALWNAKKIAGVGVSLMLTRAGISITNQVGVKRLVGICGTYTLKMFEQVGFIVDNTLGMNGLFPYPKDEYQARVLGILNASTLDTASPYDRERIEAIRNNPEHKFVEAGPKGDVIIQYKLLMS